MTPGILGKKIGMTQVFRADGQAVPVTLLKAGPCLVVQRKTPAIDGYDAVQLGLVEFVKPARINKPMTGHFKKAGVEGAKFMREFTLRPGDDDLKAGDQVLVDQFKPKDMVDVIGISKGKGFAGVVKRHHFKGGEGSHGSMFHRAPGSIGASSFPSRVFPGQRMAGQMGNKQITVRNLEVIEIDGEDQLLVLKGSIPGPENGYVMIRQAKKLWKQKGTGRARTGSVRSPIWRHGGTVHGPEPRDYSYRLNKKMIAGALRSALTDKLAENALTVIEGFKVDSPKTKAFGETLKKF